MMHDNLFKPQIYPPPRLRPKVANSEKKSEQKVVRYYVSVTGALEEAPGRCLERAEAEFLRTGKETLRLSSSRSSCVTFRSEDLRKCSAKILRISSRSSTASPRSSLLLLPAVAALSLFWLLFELATFTLLLLSLLLLSLLLLLFCKWHDHSFIITTLFSQTLNKILKSGNHFAS